MNNSILVIGSLNIDRIINVNHIPKVGETIIGSDFIEVCGGKGANQAYACGKLGGNVTMLGAVGTDDAGDRMLQSLQEVSVDVTHILRTKEVATGSAIIYVDKEGNNNIVVLSGANRYCSKEYLTEKEELIRNCDIILLQLEIPMDAVEYAIETAYKYGKKIILNPAPAHDNLNSNILHKINVLTPNETELEMLSGIKILTLDDVKHACTKLQEKGANRIVVTLGSKGALLADENGFRLFDAKKVEVVDTTAAGDTFNGALAVMMSEQVSIDQAIGFANKAAALSVQRVGAQPSIPLRIEVEKY